MSDKTTLGNRMKDFYENPFRYYLPRRTPMIIRIDMKSGHSFTRGFKRPFDDIFMTCMQQTAKYLCENIENVKLSYQQSDEISLLLTDYDNPNTEAWFARNIQKMASVSASMATMAFNKFYAKEITDGLYAAFNLNDGEWDERLQKIYYPKIDSAMFDSRCFILPKEEVCNYFQWRQMDCTRNSIQMVGQANFSHKELQHKKNEDIQEMLFSQRGINWNDFSTVEKRGSCCVKDFEKKVINFQTQEEVIRKVWGIDRNIPIFSQDRNYIEKFI